MRKTKFKKRSWYQWLGILAPAFLFNVIFFIIPLFLILIQGFVEGNVSDANFNSITFNNYINLLTDSYYWTIIGRTILIGLEVTLYSLIIGYILSYTI